MGKGAISFLAASVNESRAPNPPYLFTLAA